MLSIVIVNFKNPALLRLCLATLSRNVSAELDCEVIVVDSGTTAETQNVVREEFAGTFPRIRVIPFRENTGYTRGNNEGIRASRGEYVFILNPDTLVQKGALESMLDHLKTHPEIGMLGPQLVNFDETIQQSYFRFYNALTIVYRRVGGLPFSRWVLDRFLMKDANPAHIAPADWLMGSALMMPRDALEHVGLMDERMFHYFSEVDLARRFWEHGYQVVYYPRARIYHALKRDSKGHFWLLDALFKKEARWHIADGFRYLFKHGFFPARVRRPDLAQAPLLP